MAALRLRIPDNVIVDRSRFRRTMFITKKATEIDWLASSIREERLAVRYHRREEREVKKNLYIETKEAEDSIQLGCLLLTGLAGRENAVLEGKLGACTVEAQEALRKSKLEIVEALRISLFGRRE